MAFDPACQDRGPSALLFSEDPMRQLLDEEDSSLVWTVLGEKNIYGYSPGESGQILAISGVGRVAIGGSATGAIGSAGDQDRFAVELEAGRTYQFDLTGSPGGGGTLPDTFFRAIYDSAGEYQPDSYNDDFEGSRDSRVTFTASESGTYYARVSGDRDETGSYTLRVTDVTLQQAVFVPGPPETEPESSQGQSTPGAGQRANVSEGATDLADDADTLGVVEVDGHVARGAISEPVHREINNNQGHVVGNNHFFDRDWFKVTLQAGRTYRFDLAPVIRVRGDDTYEVSLYPEIVALYDADSNYLHYTSDRDSSGPGYAARVEFTPNADGAYYISAAGLGFTAGEYELTVSDITQDADQHTAARGTSGRVTVGGSATGKIDFEQDVDWFRVRLTAGTEYQIDLEGQATGGGSLYDPWLRGIFAANGNEIPGTRNDDGGVDYNSQLLFTPTTTDFYYVAAGGLGYLEGTYTLSVK